MKKTNVFLLCLLFVTNISLADDYITQNIANGCGTISVYRPVFEINTYNCASGQYLPANGVACASCLNNATCSGGNYTFDEYHDQGLVMNDIFTQDITGACKANFVYKPVFEINTYTCANGTYLPADGLGCVACPTDATCNGGTFNYNPTSAQGIIMPFMITQNMPNACDDHPYVYKPYFTANTYTCSAGQYLPADGVACETCLIGNYCPGGTYTFNETTTQGITACPDNKTSPAGSDDVSDCTVAGVTCAAGYYLPANANECAICLENNYCTGGTYNFDANNAQGITQCDIGYSSAAGASSCTPNTITINWGGANGVHATTQCTYGGDLTTPTTAPTKRGHTFTGWTFDAQ